MPDEARSNLAVRPVDVDRGDGGIDALLADQLVAAIVEFPTFATACASCGVTTRSVVSMLQRGIQPDAPRSLRDFCREFAKADAVNARDHSERVAMLLRDNQAASARVLVDLIDRRWPLGANGDIMTLLSGGRRTDGLKSRLRQPSALLLSMLREMLKSPNEVWESMLLECGWVRAPAPETEPSGDSPGEPDDD
jgi:hypothetical protein